jgi:predicted metal-binding membrane protein
VSLSESILRRDHFIVAAALGLLIALAWAYIWQGAGMGMTALQMTQIALLPHRHADMMAGMPMPVVTFTTIVAMWWVMMIAMMTPGVVPLVLLHARVLRHWQASSSANLPISTLAVLAGYVTAWLVFACLAALLQVALVRFGLLSEMMLSARTPWLSAGVLALAGIYQFSPTKRACLRHCGGPIEFLMRYSRSTPFMLGVRHGIWCVGCCWVLMALLFVVGVMNIAWIAALTLLVLLEKFSRASVLIRRATGVLLIAWSIATIVLTQSSPA